MKQGLFIGLTTLDLIYLSKHFPNRNEKLAASDYIAAAGGPATNAAVTFKYLGNKTNLFSVIGSHPITHLIRSDLEQHQINLFDLDSSFSDSPAISSIIVTEGTGDRAVISINAIQYKAPKNSISLDKLPEYDLVLIDGHQIEVGEAIAESAKSKNIPVVIDGGSWKPGLDRILPFVNYAICSANFYPPSCQTSEDVFNYLQSFGINSIAITRGNQPIDYFHSGNSGKVNVPQIQAIDTLGAGDIFHGAFCHYILQQDFIEALNSAAKIAAFSCQFFGTRQWMKEK